MTVAYTGISNSSAQSYRLVKIKSSRTCTSVIHASTWVNIRSRRNKLQESASHATPNAMLGIKLSSSKIPISIATVKRITAREVDASVKNE